MPEILGKDIYCEYMLFSHFKFLGDIGNYYYGQGHPMKPHRIRMTHNLLLNYGLYRKMEIYRPHKATQEEMTKFHSDDYIRFLRSIRPDNMGEYNKQMQVRTTICRIAVKLSTPLRFLSLHFRKCNTG